MRSLPSATESGRRPPTPCRRSVSLSACLTENELEAFCLDRHGIDRLSRFTGYASPSPRVDESSHLGMLAFDVVLVVRELQQEWCAIRKRRLIVGEDHGDP